MAVWFTSDWHFNHNKEFLYKPRGYNSPEEMNRDIIARHNALVASEEDVYVLGDCALGGAEKLDENYQLMRQLNGLLHIILGNHDTNKKIEMYSYLPNVVEIQPSLFWKYGKYHFYLNHFPTLTANFDDDKPLKQKIINLCGHSHCTDKFNDIDKGLIYHCELDCHNNNPINIEQIIKDLKTYDKIIKTENVIERCNKCVWTKSTCGDSDIHGLCKTYKRDPPDGGYYG